MIYPKAKRYNKQTIKTEHFTAYTAFFRRGGYGGACEAFIYSKTDGRSRIEGIYKWCNRPWCRFEEESAIENALDRCSWEDVELAKAEFKQYFDRKCGQLDEEFKAFETAYKGLTDSQKETLSGITVTNESEFKAVNGIVQIMSLLNK